MRYVSTFLFMAILAVGVTTTGCYKTSDDGGGDRDAVGFSDDDAGTMATYDDGTPTVQVGCETLCRSSLKCFGGSSSNIDGCVDGCLHGAESANDACKEATRQLGVCGEKRTCEQFKMGACQDVIAAHNDACG